MTIYNSEKSKKTSDDSKDALVDDDSFGEEESTSDDVYLRKLDNRQAAMRLRLRRGSHGLIIMFVVLLVVFVVVACVVGALHIFKHTAGPPKPVIELLKMHYHEWKTGRSGNKDFVVEGEFYQQTEVDIAGETYVKLNVPAMLGYRSASVLHDFKEKLTAIIDPDKARCFVLPLNFTLVKPSVPEFYQFVKNVKAGFDSPDAEVIRDSFRLIMPAISEVVTLGTRIFAQCRYWETYRLQRDDEPLALSKRSACAFKGEHYCLGNAGSPFMQILAISECIE